MLFTFLQTGTISMEELFPIIFIVAVAAGDILLLKLGLVITKAKLRTRMKWVAGSFLIQFAIIFIISSPLFLLGAMGAFNDDGGPGAIIIPIILLSAFIDLNIVNILHQIGLKRSLIIVVIILVPIVFIMISLGDLLSQMP
jgi:hypothetical protein